MMKFVIVLLPCKTGGWETPASISGYHLPSGGSIASHEAERYQHFPWVETHGYHQASLRDDETHGYRRTGGTTWQRVRQFCRRRDSKLPGTCACLSAPHSLLPGGMCNNA